MLEKSIQEIKEMCITKGESALLELTKSIDRVELKTIVYQSDDEISIDPRIQDAILRHKARMEIIYQAMLGKLQKPETITIEGSVIYQQKFIPINHVGICATGKSFMDTLMLIILAKAAGCRNITVCTAPNPSPILLFIFQITGVKMIYTVSTIPAIFAMAHGIGEIPKVDRIFAPDDHSTTIAKKMMPHGTEIELYGKSYIMTLIADEDADIAGITNDLLAHLEQDINAKAYLFSTSSVILKIVSNKIPQLIANSSYSHILKHSAKNIQYRRFDRISLAIKASNLLSPTHLVLNVNEPHTYIDLISNTPCIMIGKYSTSAMARSLSNPNVTILSFGRFVNFHEIKTGDLTELGNDMINIAAAECLEFSIKSISSRLGKLETYPKI